MQASSTLNTQDSDSECWDLEYLAEKRSKKEATTMHVGDERNQPSTSSGVRSRGEIPTLEPSTCFGGRPFVDASYNSEIEEGEMQGPPMQRYNSRPRSTNRKVIENKIDYKYLINDVVNAL